MRKAFTLVELLVVVAVIAILMAMVIRLGSTSSDASKRLITVNRLQRLENALSGYYAAFGSYPPVRVQGSRNIYREVADDGVQSENASDQESMNWNDEEGSWAKVKAACESQPVACNFPYQSNNKFVELVAQYNAIYKKYIENLSEGAISKERREVIEKGFSIGTPMLFSECWTLSEWTEIQLFRFGLLSFLLPRYQFMMQCDDRFFVFAQWEDNNRKQKNALTNEELEWEDISRLLFAAQEEEDEEEKKRILLPITSISSQSVCARWMANFEHTLYCDQARNFYGIDVRVPDQSGRTFENYKRQVNELRIYQPGGYNDGGGQYILDGITIKDGWDNDFYYYSPSPHQSYVVWSAGPNGKTFPPWVPRETLSSEGDRCVGKWVADDIVGMRN